MCTLTRSGLIRTRRFRCVVFNGTQGDDSFQCAFGSRLGIRAHLYDGSVYHFGYRA